MAPIRAVLVAVVATQMAAPGFNGPGTLADKPLQPPSGGQAGVE